jgi:hypothetical protein
MFFCSNCVCTYVQSGPKVGKHYSIQLVVHLYSYEAFSESKYRLSVKKNCVRFGIKFYCYQILHSSDYFSTYLPPLLWY